MRLGSSEETEEDHLTGLELEQFLEVFNLPPVGDPLEKQRRAEKLKENQQKVLEANQAFLAGNQSWWEEIPSRALSGYRDVGPACSLPACLWGRSVTPGLSGINKCLLSCVFVA